MSTTLSMRYCPSCREPKPQITFSRNEIGAVDTTKCNDCYEVAFGPVERHDKDAAGISTAPKPDTLGQPTFAACTGHPDCKGPSLVEDHDAVCPFGGGDDCDNETCYRGCEHCTTEGALS